MFAVLSTDTAGADREATKAASKIMLIREFVNSGKP